MEDLQCLDSGEFLNDVIIDFYLKLVTSFLKSWEMYKQRRSGVESMLMCYCKPDTSSTKLLLL